MTQQPTLENELLSSEIDGGPCKEPGCDREGSLVRGMCGLHYGRWYAKREGRPKTTDPEFAIRYAESVTQLGECLGWSGSKNQQGYAQMAYQGVTVLAHRYVYELKYGPIPENMKVDHKCHTAECSELTHLRLVTNKQNAENRKGLNSNNSSGYPNVYRDKKTNRWFVKVEHHGKKHYGGYFDFEDLDKAGAVALELKNKLFTHNDLDRTKGTNL